MTSLLEIEDAVEFWVCTQKGKLLVPVGNSSNQPYTTSGLAITMTLYLHSRLALGNVSTLSL